MRCWISSEISQSFVRVLPRYVKREVSGRGSPPTVKVVVAECEETSWDNTSVFFCVDGEAGSVICGVHNVQISLETGSSVTGYRGIVSIL